MNRILAALKRLAMLTAITALSGCGAKTDTPEAAAKKSLDFGLRIINADKEPWNWLSTSRDYSEQRFSPLTEIDKSNIQTLGLAWYHEFDTDRGQEATPLVVDGVLYVSTAWSKVYAFNAGTGELLWQYDPEVDPEKADRYCCDVVNRGVAAWENRIYIGAIDGRLISLNAETGDEQWSVLTVKPDSYGSITGAPRVVKGKVLIGNSGADYGERGYITAYDAKNGEQLWRFYTVPGDPSRPFENPALAFAATTWTGEWWAQGGGGTVWDAMAYDPEADLLYIGVGNGYPHSHAQRSPEGGDNLFLASIVALRPDTGKYVWHYQTTPADNWDYTATQPMILADLEIDGKLRKVIMQAPKNGFFYVLDRLTGELLSAENFVETRWASHIDMATGRPVEDPHYREYPTRNMPSYFGGHNWQPMAYSPQTGYAYFPWHEVVFPSAGGITVEGKSPEGATIPEEEIADPSGGKPLPTAGGLLAWDVQANKPAWRLELDWPINGGALATAGGLVFQGAADGTFAAYDAGTGDRLWDWQASNGILAGPISYGVDGSQYIAVLAGYGGAPGMAYGYASPDRPRLPGRLFVFTLGGNAQAEPQHWQPKEPLDLSHVSIPSSADSGRALYNSHCLRCHGIRADAGILPDLRYSPFILDATAWESVVLDGALSSRGMVGFANLMDVEQAEAIRGFLLEKAKKLQVESRQ